MPASTAFVSFERCGSRCSVNLNGSTCCKHVCRTPTSFPSIRFSIHQSTGGPVDAIFTGYDRALAYSVAYPQFAAVVPAPDFGSIPIAISVPAGEEPLLISRTPLSRWEPRRESSRKARLLDQGRRGTARTGAALVDWQKCPRLVEMKSRIRARPYVLSGFPPERCGSSC